MPFLEAMPGVQLPTRRISHEGDICAGWCAIGDLLEQPGQDRIAQALPLMLPTFGNNAIELLKATSVVSLISLADMTFQAQVVRSQTGNTLLPFVTILVLYFAMSSVLSFAIRSYERRVTRGLDGVR